LFDDTILNHELNSLRHFRRPSTALLNLLQVVGSQPSRSQRSCQDIGRRNRILNRQIDPHTADRRHRMGRITDAE